jgi:hypothetical protein
LVAIVVSDKLPIPLKEFIVPTQGDLQDDREKFMKDVEKQYDGSLIVDVLRNYTSERSIFYLLEGSNCSKKRV